MSPHVIGVGVVCRIPKTQYVWVYMLSFRLRCDAVRSVSSTLRVLY